MANNNCITLTTGSLRALAKSCSYPTEGPRNTLIETFTANNRDLPNIELADFTLKQLTPVATHLKISKTFQAKNALITAILEADKKAQNKETEMLELFASGNTKSIMKLLKRYAKKSGNKSSSSDTDSDKDPGDGEKKIPKRDRAINNPSLIEFPTLESMEDKSVIDNWLASVRNTCKINRFWVEMNALTYISENSPAEDVVKSTELEDAIKASPRKEQLAELIKEGLLKSLKPEIRTVLNASITAGPDVDGGIADTPWSVLKEILNRAEHLTTARGIKTRHDISLFHWRKSKMSLTTWYSSLVAKCQELDILVFPLGLPRENLLRNILLKNF